MKRISIVLLAALLVYACAAVAQGVTIREGQAVVYKFVPRSWEFARADGPTITVIMDPAGTLTVLENGVFIGQRYDSCQVAE